MQLPEPERVQQESVMKPTGKSNDLRHAAGGLAVAAALAAFGVLMPTVASAQMYDQSWNFKPRDRAGLAVVMKQAESGMFDRSSSTGGSMGRDRKSTRLN